MTDDTINKIFKCFSPNLCTAINSLKGSELDSLREVRIRQGKPVVVYIGNTPTVITKAGELCELTEEIYSNSEIITTTSDELKNAYYRLCEYSVYRRQSEINSGFITVNGGHRIGVCGTAILSGGEIKSVADITSLNVRIAREFIGCADEFFAKGLTGGSLIVGKPSTGKTTLLRDIARQISLKYGKKCAVIDERFELSATACGKPGFDLGLCDIYCGYAKREAILQAVRTMSPDCIVCDELTGDDEAAVYSCVNLGVDIIASVHCDSLENLMKNSAAVKLIKTGAFKNLIFLGANPCEIEKAVRTGELKID